MMDNRQARLRTFDRQMLRSEIFSTIWAVAATRADDPHSARSVLSPLAAALHMPFARLRRWFNAPCNKNLTIDEIADLANAADAEIIFKLRDRATGQVFAAFGPDISRADAAGDTND